MDSYEFARVFDTLACLSVTVRISINENGIRFEVWDSTGHGEICFPVRIKSSDEDDFFSKKHTDKRSARVVVKEPASVLLSIPHLERIARASFVADEVCIKISDNKPCIVSSFVLPSLESAIVNAISSACTKRTWAIYVIISLRRRTKINTYH